MAPEMQTNRRWIRSWLPWNLDRIFSLVAAGAASGAVLSEEQARPVEPLHREAHRVVGWAAGLLGPRALGLDAPTPRAERPLLAVA